MVVFFLNFCRLIFFNINLLRKLFQEYYQCQTSLDPDQARHFVGPDLDANCWLSLSADDKIRLQQAKSKKRVLYVHNSSDCLVSK